MSLRSALSLFAITFGSVAWAQDGGDVFVSLGEGQSGRIFLDGQDTEIDAPGTLRDVPAGNHIIQVKGDCVSAVSQVDVQPGVLKRTSLDLQPLGGFVEIYLLTDGATVSVDGTDYTGTYQALDLSCGSHELVASATNYTTQTRYLDVQMGEAYRVEFDLSNENAGTLSVLVDPVEANLYVDNHFVAQGPATLDNLVIGSHTLRASLEGYEDHEETVEVVSGEITQVEILMLPETLIDPNEQLVGGEGDDVLTNGNEGGAVNTRQLAGGVVLGLSGGVGVASLLTYASARTAHTEIQDQISSGALTFAEGEEEAAGDSYAKRRLAVALGGVALVGAGAGGWLFFMDAGQPMLGYTVSF